MPRLSLTISSVNVWFIVTLELETENGHRNTLKLIMSLLLFVDLFFSHFACLGILFVPFCDIGLCVLSSLVIISPLGCTTVFKCIILVVPCVCLDISWLLALM